MNRPNPKSHLRDSSLVMTAVATIAVMLSVSCFDTKTSLCEKYGVRCRPDQVCAANQAVCIFSGGCGDAVVGIDEECDDGNVVNGDGCSVNCTLQRCGNRIVEPGEDCDVGPGGSQGCDDDCTFVECGDGHLNTLAREECDTGSEHNPSCNALCKLPICGDRISDLELGEHCDTGGDSIGCDADCTSAVCGDGYVNDKSFPPGSPLPEVCDTGGVNASDCDRDCTKPLCGDGIHNSLADEECDDNNMSNDDSCVRDTLGRCKMAWCGDGFVRMQGPNPEQCDDSNFNNNDFCVGTCMNATCGDGFVRTHGTSPEQCDNGTANHNDIPNACRTDCRTAFCGDGVRDAGEMCDPGGSYGNGDTCSGLLSCLPNCLQCI